jgi:hypothetical protein
MIQQHVCVRVRPGTATSSGESDLRLFVIRLVASGEKRAV